MFQTLFNLGSQIVETFSGFANWAFTAEFDVLGATFTPIGVMLGTGLIAYAAYTIILYLVP